MPESEIAEAMERIDGDDDDDDDDQNAFGLWPENNHSLKCFLLVRRQWRIGPLGGVLGLDYLGVKAVLSMRKIKIDTELLDDLEVMEGGAMVVLNAKP